MTDRKAKASATSLISGRDAGSANQSPRSSRSNRRPIVLGLDLSLAGTGMVVWDGSKVLRWRLLQTDPLSKEGQSQGLLPSGMYRGHLEDRIEWQRRAIAATFRKFLPDLVVIEEYAFGAKGRGLSALHELGGTVKNHLFRKSAVYLQVHNSVIKQYATGKGNASKEEMIAAAAEFWPEGPWNGIRIPIKKADNVADAYWLSHWGREHRKLLTSKVSGSNL